MISDELINELKDKKKEIFDKFKQILNFRDPAIDPNSD